MGGAYLTLLNTIANMGVILPKTPVFALIDALTSSTCRGPKGAPVRLPPGLHCAKKARDLGLGPAAEACAAAGGACVLERDGFYVVSYAMAALGLALGVMIMRLFPRLTRLPLERWRAGAGGGTAAARGTKGG
jgi:PAT family acetyl-CoA transporter-like MFS transporter 1